MDLPIAPTQSALIRCCNRLQRQPSAVGYRAAWRQWLAVWNASEAPHPVPIPVLGRHWRVEARPFADLFFLSPAFHRAIAAAAARTGDTDDARAHSTWADVLCGLVLGSGQGTAAAPFLVTHPADEYAVCAFLGWEPACQSLVIAERDRYLDRLADEDGREMVFDMTPFLRPQPAGVGASPHHLDITETGHKWSARWSS